MEELSWEVVKFNFGVISEHTQDKHCLLCSFKDNSTQILKALPLPGGVEQVLTYENVHEYDHGCQSSNG